MGRSVFSIRRARLGIASKHLDKPSTGYRVPNGFHHQSVRRNPFRRVDKRSEVSLGPFHCGNTLTLTNDEVKRIPSIDVNNRRVIENGRFMPPVPEFLGGEQFQTLQLAPPRPPAVRVYHFTSEILQPFPCRSSFHCGDSLKKRGAFVKQYSSLFVVVNTTYWHEKIRSSRIPTKQSILH